MPTEITWDDNEIRTNLAAYGRRARAAVWQVGAYWAPHLEAYAKENARWTDRTGNARQALRGFVLPPTPEAAMSSSQIAIYLSHGMSYGVFLELRWAGRYAIILPTLQAHYGAIARMLRDVFS